MMNSKRNKRTIVPMWAAASVPLLLVALHAVAETEEGPRRAAWGRPTVEYSVSWMPTASVEDQEADLAMIGQTLSFSSPVVTLPRGVIGLDANVRLLTLDTSAVFPENGTELPALATVARLGIYHTQIYSNGWLSRVSAGVLSGSETPLDSNRIVGLTANAFLRVPTGEGNAWRLIVLFRPTETGLPFPIPLAAYEWRAGDTLSLELGIPMGIEWKPRSRLILKAAYIPLADIEATAELGIANSPATLLLGFGTKDEIYWIKDIDDDLERTRFSKTTVSAGLRLDVSKLGWIRIGTSYQFDRSLGLGYNAFRGGNADDEIIETANGVTLEAGVGVRF